MAGGKYITLHYTHLLRLRKTGSGVNITAPSAEPPTKLCIDYVGSFRSLRGVGDTRTKSVLSTVDRTPEQILGSWEAKGSPIPIVKQSRDLGDIWRTPASP